MRDGSIPAWNYLREPSLSSVALSEDELQDYSSQETTDKDKVQFLRPSQSSNSVRLRLPRQSATQYIGNMGRVTASSSRMPPPTQALNSRRPLSESDEGNLRPKKKKKIINPETAALALTRVSLGGSTDTTPLSPDNKRRRSMIELPVPASSESGKHNRGLTSTSSTASSSTSNIIVPPATQRTDRGAPGPSWKASDRNLFRTKRNGTQASQSSRTARRVSALPPPPEVIVISDSDDVIVPPPPPKSASRPASTLTLKSVSKTTHASAPNCTPSSIPKLTSTQKTRSLPRRSTHKCRPYRVDENGYIIVDDSDDEPLFSTPTVQNKSNKTKPIKILHPTTPSGLPSASALGISATHTASSSVAFLRTSVSPITSLPLTTASPTVHMELDSSPSRVLPSNAELSVPSPTSVQEDVSMTDEHSMASDTHEEVAVATWLNMGPADDNILPSRDSQVDLGTTVPEEHDNSPEDSCGPVTEVPISPATAVGIQLEDVSRHEPTALGPLVTQYREGLLVRGETSTLGSASPTELPPTIVDKQVTIEEVESHLLSRSSMAPELTARCAESASPVSSILDPQLQDLAISTPPCDSGDRNTSGLDSPSISAATLSPSYPSSTQVRSRRLTSPFQHRVRMRGTLHGGPKGFFADLHRQSQKQARTLSRSQTLASSPRTVSPGGFPLFPTVVSRENEVSQGSTSAVATATEAAPMADIDMRHVSVQLSSMQASGARPEVDLRTDSKQFSDGESSKSVELLASSTRSPTPTNNLQNLGRSSTPPLEVAHHSSVAPLGPTLSQIIKNAMNENARRQPIDLSAESSHDDLNTNSIPGKGKAPCISNPQAVLSADSAISCSSNVEVSANANAVPSATRLSIKTLDLNAIRSIRRVPLLPSPSLPPQSSPLKPRSPLPLPRNMRRVSAPTGSASFAQPSMETPATSGRDSTSTLPQAGVAVSNATSSTCVTPPPASQGPSKLVLPRRHDIIRSTQTDQPVAACPVMPTSASVGVSVKEAVTDSLATSGTGASSGAESSSTLAHAPIPSMQLHDTVTSPPRSRSPSATDEEGTLSLAYPSSSTEESPDVEMVDEDEEPIRPPTGRRVRGSRRSSRLSSTSASSLAATPEPVESRIGRLRRREREPFVRTLSDGEIASHGGISRFGGNVYSRMFEDVGFEALDWTKDRKRVAREFAPVTRLAENIPHDLQDRLNSLNISARRAGNMQIVVFEAEIRANTAEDEPQAPPVRVINDVDDEPTPPLEFYYSNLMWHGKGVPKPDYDKLEGCDCVGPCDPSSKTCSCIKRQKSIWNVGPSGQGFIYDKKGKLRTEEYPVFECNMNCGCSDVCSNRVIQHGRKYELAIQKTPNKGWGVFNGPKKIPAFSYIGLYAGEYLMDAEGEARGKIYNKFGRTYLFDVDFWYLNKEQDGVKYCIDAYHAGNFTRYLNHSCDPNCAIVAAYINESNQDKPLLSIFTIEDVEPYEELCFSYFGASDDSDNIVDEGTSKMIDGAVYVKCQCGATNCRGTMWR